MPPLESLPNKFTCLIADYGSFDTLTYQYGVFRINARFYLSEEDIDKPLHPDSLVSPVYLTKSSLTKKLTCSAYLFNQHNIKNFKFLHPIVKEWLYG